MARARGANDGLVWPPHLAVCRPIDWLDPDDDLTDIVTRRYLAWSRWINARAYFLLDRGADSGSAQVESVGEFPK